jgi:hypothetical protein
MKMQKRSFAIGAVTLFGCLVAMGAVNGIFNNLTAVNLTGPIGGLTPNTGTFTTGSFSGALASHGITNTGAISSTGNITAPTFVGNASTASALSGAITTCLGVSASGISANGNAICPNLANSFATSGYVTLPNGLIFEWVVGTTTVGPTARQNVTETWPLAFPHACFTAIPGVKLDSGVSTNNEGYGAYLNSCSTTTVSAYMDSGADGVGDVNHRLVAYGIGN